MLETRVGEPPLTGRELRLLVAMLDINGSNTLSRQEFEDGLRDCRCVSAYYGQLGGGVVCGWGLGKAVRCRTGAGQVSGGGAT